MQTSNSKSDFNLAPLEDTEAFPNKPGELRGSVWLSIQTHQAQRLFRGRPAADDKPAIIGLIGFANRLKVIWQGARGDDPYADWWLIKIHEAIEAAGVDLRTRRQSLAEQLTRIQAIDVDIATSNRPYRVPLTFANPYAYRGARLLSDFDHLVCLALTLRHVGLLTNQAGDALVNAAARKLRSLFLIPQDYQLLKLNRDQVRAGVGRSSEARRLMGELPAEVLDGARQAPLMPTRRELPSGLSGQVGLHSTSVADAAARVETDNDDI